MKFLIIDEQPIFAEGLKHIIKNAYLESYILKLLDVESLKYVNDNFDIAFVNDELILANNMDLFQHFSINKISKIIFISEEESFDKISKAKKYGASGFLSKKAKFLGIVKAIDSVVSCGCFWPDFSQSDRRKMNEVKKNSDKECVYKMTKRQVEIVELISKGYSNKKIARTLGISLNTVKTHASNIFSVLNVNSRSGCVSKFLSVDK